MEQWYHSGIEGYCKAAAQAMGLPNDQSGWGNFGRDLFGDGRFDDPVKTSKTWTLSRSRSQGRSNRPMLFEKSWLGAHGPQFEEAAVTACVHNMLKEDGDSSFLVLYESGYIAFANKMRTIVLPAIMDGFKTERYHSADITRFAQVMDELLGELSPNDPETLSALATRLVAAIIYGPAHDIVRTSQHNATRLVTHQTAHHFNDDFGMESSSVRITQLFSHNMSLLGYSETFHDDKVVFFGRGGDIGRYLQKCPKSLVDELAGRTPVLFPIAGSHIRTSNEHGALAQVGDNWYYYDFSTNGTAIKNPDADDPQQSPSLSGPEFLKSLTDNAEYPTGPNTSEDGVCVHGSMIALSPGDRLCLGVDSLAAPDDTLFHSATSILISFNVEESAAF